MAEGERDFPITPGRNLEPNMEELCLFLRNNGTRLRVRLGSVTLDHGLSGKRDILKSVLVIIEGANSQKRRLRLPRDS